MMRLPIWASGTGTPCCSDSSEAATREVGEVMGVSEDAARQRIYRAIERLRAYFNRRE